MLSFPRTLVLALGVLACAAAAWADATDELFRSAADHYGKKHWQAACDDFARLLADHGDHPRANQARFHYGEALVQLGRYADARKQFDALLEHDPNDRYARQARFRGGEAAYLAGDRAAARAALESFRQRYADDELNAYVLAHLGRIELDDGKPAAAEPLFAAAIERFKDGPLVEPCRLGLAEAHEELGQPDLARREYQQIIDAASPLADYAMLHSAALDNAQGNPAAALARLDRLAKDFPDSPLQDKVRLGRGYALYKLQRHAEAQQVLSGLADHPTLAVDASYWLGMAQSAQEQWSAAAKTFAAAGNIDSRHRLNPALAYHAGKALFQDGKPAEAAEAFDRVLDRWPDSPWADDCLLGKLQVCARRGDHAGCARVADEFIARFPDSPLRSDVDEAKGRALAALGKDAEAAAALERSLAEKPAGEKPSARAAAEHKSSKANDRAEAQAALAMTYARLGRFADAARISTALADETPPTALAVETCYQVAEAAYAAGDVEVAAGLFTLLTRPGGPPDAIRRGLLGQGWCRFKSNDWSGAAGAFEQLLAQFPDSPAAAEAALMRGRALEHLEDSPAALAMYRVVIDRHPDSSRVAEALYRAAGLCEQSHESAQAIEWYSRLVREHAGFAQFDGAIYRWAWLARQNDQPDVADELFDRLRRDFPDSPFVPDATLRLAERALADGKHDEAGRLAAEVANGNAAPPIRQTALYLQGRAAAAAGQWPAAEQALARLIEEFPAGEWAPAAAYLRAEASYRQGDYALASQRLAELASRSDLRQQPWAAPAQLRRAQALAQLKEWDQALEIARSVGEEFPDFQEQYEADYVIGRSLAAKAEFVAAREAYARVIASARGGKSETAAMARWMIGESYFHQENYAAAIAEYEQVDEHPFPRWQAAALLQAGKCRELLGQWPLAVAAYERLLTKFPDSELAAEATSRALAARERLAARSPPK